MKNLACQQASSWSFLMSRQAWLTWAGQASVQEGQQERTQLLLPRGQLYLSCSERPGVGPFQSQPFTIINTIIPQVNGIEV